MSVARLFIGPLRPSYPACFCGSRFGDREPLLRTANGRGSLDRRVCAENGHVVLIPAEDAHPLPAPTSPDIAQKDLAA